MARDEVRLSLVVAACLLVEAVVATAAALGLYAI
jgi:hypothetical protein